MPVVPSVVGTFLCLVRVNASLWCSQVGRASGVGHLSLWRPHPGTHKRGLFLSLERRYPVHTLGKLAFAHQNMKRGEIKEAFGLAAVPDSE